MSERHPERREDTEPAARSASGPLCGRHDLRVIDANELLQGEREICIVLDGERYRLRLTRRNRLILQK
jgi:hemin uptake protein HemP